jgi:hypothetical protein
VRKLELQSIEASFLPSEIHRAEHAMCGLTKWNRTRKHCVCAASVSVCSEKLGGENPHRWDHLLGWFYAGHLQWWPAIRNIYPAIGTEEAITSRGGSGAFLVEFACNCIVFRGNGKEFQLLYCSAVQSCGTRFRFIFYRLVVYHHIFKYTMGGGVGVNPACFIPSLSFKYTFILYIKKLLIYSKIKHWQEEPGLQSRQRLSTTKALWTL